MANESASSSSTPNSTPHSPPHLSAPSTSSSGVLGLRSAMKHSSSSRHSSRPTTPNPPSSPIPRQSFARKDSNDVQVSGDGLLSVASQSHSGTGYTSKVSFDTFENRRDEAMFSYTLQTKTENYSRNKNTRVFLCAASSDESGSSCLEWVLESLIQDSDELVVLRGFDSDVLGTAQDSVRQDARDLLAYLQSKCLTIDPSRQISIVVEFVAGNVTKTIERLIALYRPDSLIVGTRGQRSVIQTWGAKFQLNKVGSVSKWCLSHSPVPVIVVRPERKVRKTVEKRRNDPKRGLLFGDSPKSPGPGIGSLPLTKSIG